MSTKLLLCDTADGLAQLQYALMKADADLETEVVSHGFRAVEIASRIHPDVVVVEIGIDGLSGTELIGQLLAAVPETRVICWTVVASPFSAAEMLAAGASAYMLKEDGPDAVVKAIRVVQAGSVALSPRVSEQMSGRFAESLHLAKDLEAEVVETSERLKELTTAKADFLANVSHELRTPITVAKGIAYVLKNRGLPEEEQVEFLDKLESSLERLLLLVDEMLTIADLDRGSLSLKLSEVDLAPIVRHVVDEMSRQHPNVAIEALIPDALQGTADPIRIAEVVRQILDNGCRYSPPNRPVQIRGRTVEEGVVISVTDHGSGVARDLMSKAFTEPFATGEDTLTKERSGAGLGLHMARQLVVQHGGIIWADPLPGGGTRVSFCLPIHKGQTVATRPVLTTEGLGPPDAGEMGTNGLIAPGYEDQPTSAATSS